MSSWADHFNTYQDACDFYGCDGPRELAIEARFEAEEACIANQDWIEAHGRPCPNWLALSEDIAF